MKQVIVIVYLNAKLPKYALTNLLNLSRTFPQKEIILITDLDRNIDRATKKGIKTFQVPGILELWPEVSENASHPTAFRAGFWITSIIRFKAIERFMKENTESQIIHIEADVLLLPNFPFEKIINFPAPISYPLVSSELAAASVFIARDFNSIAAFNSKVQDLIIKNPDLTDMTALAEISREHPDLVSILPTMTNVASDWKNSVAGSCKQFSANYSYFQGVFDAATWGMYFFGTDPRNLRGVKKIGTDFETHAIKAKGHHLRNQENGNIEIFGNSEIGFKLYNLHVHSKNISIFDYPRKKGKIRIYKIFHRIGVKRLLSFRIFLRLVFAKLLRNFRESK